MICTVSRTDFLINIRKMRSFKKELIIYMKRLIKLSKNWDVQNIWDIK